MFFFFIVQIGGVIAQQNTGFFGKVIESKTKNPLGFVVVSIQNTTLMQLTKTDGNFSFDTVPTGNVLLLIHSQGFKDALYPIEIIEGKMLDLGTIVLEEDQSTEQQSSLITLIESDFSDDNSSSESTSGLLQSSRDAFLQAAAFN
jgi:hypothetical protein